MKRCRKLEEIVEKVKAEFPKAIVSVSRKNARIGIYIDPITSISIYIVWWDSFKVSINRFSQESWDILRDTFLVNEISMIKLLLSRDIKERL